MGEKETALVLIVDDDVLLAQGLAEGLEEMGFACQVAYEGGKALRMLHQYHPAAMVIDIRMPGVDGIQVLQQARACDPNIAAVMLTALDYRRLAVEALKSGASDYLVKPVRLGELSTSLNRALERRRLIQKNRDYQADLEHKVASRAKELEEAHRATLAALVAALDLREGLAPSHSQRVTQYALAIAQRMGLDEAHLEAIRLGGPLHDVGKIGIPDAILRKPGPLTHEEMAEIKRHPQLGYQIVAKMEYLVPALPLVLHHHECWDGTGYPDGLQGDQIPLPARVFAVVDAYDAMTSDRVYRQAISKQEAIAELEAGAGSQFDPAIVVVMLEVLGEGG